MNRQEVFDTIARHAATHPQCFNTEKDVCMYLDPDTGNKCLVGAILPEEALIPAIEGSGVRQLPPLLRVKGLEHVAEMLEDIGITFLDKLQHIHDNPYLTGGGEWDSIKYDQLKWVAETYYLDTTALEEAFKDVNRNK